MNAPRLITHHFPVRRDLVVPLTLPVELTEDDALRIAIFLDGVAFDDEAPTDGATSGGDL